MPRPLEAVPPSVPRANVSQYRAFQKRLQFLATVLRDLASTGIQATDDKFQYVSQQYDAVQAKLQQLAGVGR